LVIHPWTAFGKFQEVEMKALHGAPLLDDPSQIRPVFGWRGLLLHWSSEDDLCSLKVDASIRSTVRSPCLGAVATRRSNAPA
jgi:hypothetical protein